MTDTLRHRGPDDGDLWLDERAGIALGHRRLSIVDLSVEGRQPMISGCGRYVTTFNGEIYNFPDLRSELSARGHSFRGGSDTEVMLAAFTQWGVVPALERLNGMFAFAVWDRERRILHLARDRLGEKPLYYGRIGGTFAFASELKALRALPGFHASVDRDALAMMLRNRYIPSPRSIYQGIAKLPPGTHLTVASRGLDPQPVKYWSAVEVAARGLDEPLQVDAEAAVEMIDGLLRDAVKLRMTADVPLGAFLSGGVDSSIVAALMQAQSTSPIRTFTVGLADAGYDESADARAVAHHLGTDHAEVRVSPREALDVIPRLPAMFDEPFCDSSQVPTFLVSRFARRQVTVALSGDGGDELFGGYNRYAWLASVWRRIGWLPPALRRGVGTALRSVSPGAWESMFRAAGGTLPRW
ncbi:MAG: asparagine synthase (glutamine-hydrolyzing), partial [Actinobacteria bacterium]